MKKITWHIIDCCLVIHWNTQKIKNYFIGFKKDKHDYKIFCIGAPKTATTSLHKALKILDYDSCRVLYWSYYQKYGEDKYIQKIKKVNFESFVDYPFGENNFYKKIDEEIPNSKFILTIRDPVLLKKSYIKFFENTHWPVKEKIKNIDNQIKHIEKRNKEVLSYFKNDNCKLLVMDITKGDGWGKLCSFLNKPTPKKQFPYKNKGRYKK